MGYEVGMTNNEHISGKFTDELNKHGYGFHHAVIKEAEKLFNQRKSLWIFEAAEFPIHLNGKDSRVDIVLHNPKYNMYLIGECKRVDPSLSSWCFTRAPLVRYNQSPNDEIVLEKIRNHRSREYASSHEQIFASEPYIVNWGSDYNPYNIGFPIKTSTTGDGSGNRDDIENSLGQVIRCMNGFVSTLMKNRNKLDNDFNFIPVIFTTSEIWTTTDDFDLSSAELTSGHLDRGKTKMEKRDWIFYNYHLSPSLHHNYDKGKEQEIHELLQTVYTRTVVIVSVAGIEEFLSLDWKL